MVWSGSGREAGRPGLRAAGFAHVACHTHTYPHAVATDEWCRLVKGRFWSTFSNFTDEELEDGCRQVRASADGGDTLRFDDRLLLIEARVGK